MEKIGIASRLAVKRLLILRFEKKKAKIATVSVTGDEGPRRGWASVSVTAALNSPLLSARSLEALRDRRLRT